MEDVRAYTLTSAVRLSRIHKAGRSPWWFGSAGNARFDLAAPYGTCYLALERVGAFIEVVDNLAIVPEAEVAARRLSTVTVSCSVRLADLANPRARGAGLTAEVHSSRDRRATQAIAAALHEAGFDGVRYLLRNDPSQRNVGIALFGPAGPADLPILETEPIPPSVLDEAAATFGIETLP